MNLEPWTRDLPEPTEQEMIELLEWLDEGGDEAAVSAPPWEE